MESFFLFFYFSARDVTIVEQRRFIGRRLRSERPIASKRKTRRRNFPTPTDGRKKKTIFSATRSNRVRKKETTEITGNVRQPNLNQGNTMKLTSNFSEENRKISQ